MKVKDKAVYSQNVVSVIQYFEIFSKWIMGETDEAK